MEEITPDYELEEFNAIIDDEDDIENINPNLLSVSQLPSREYFCKPIQYPIIFTPYDIKENQIDGYSLELYGSEIGGNKVKVTVTDIPTDFYIIVNSKLFGDKDYYTEEQPGAIEKIQKLFNDHNVLKNQFNKLIKKLMETPYVKEDMLAQDFVELCKVYNVYDPDPSIFTGSNGYVLRKMLECGAIELYKCDSSLVAQAGDDNCNCILTTAMKKVMTFYHEMPIFCIHVNINSKRDILRLRKRAIKLCEVEGYSTYNNDMSAYYRKISRENDLQLSAVLSVPAENSSIRDVKYIDDSDKCPALVMTFDIETYSDNPNGDVPDGARREDHVFMIACTFHWHNKKEPFLSVVLMTFDTKPSKNWKTVVCANESDLILQFGKLFRQMKPDIIIGFNDTYDWGFIVKKAHLLNILDKLLTEMGEEVRKPTSEREIKVLAILEKYNMTIDDFIENRHPTDIDDDDSDYLSDPYYDVRDFIRENCGGNPNKYRIMKKQSGRNDLPNIVDNKNLIQKKDLKKYFCYQQNKDIKITADEIMTVSYLKITGCISIDVRVCFRKLYTRDSTVKSSLNTFLALEKLESKDDLPIATMFRYIREYQKTTVITEEHLKRNRIIARYCLHDAQRCQELMHKRVIYTDFRSLANISYTSFNDSYVGANGIKVRNLTAKEAHSVGYIINMIPPKLEHKMAKYTGAYVIHPNKGKSPSAKLLKAIFALNLPLSEEDAVKFIKDNEEEFIKSRPIAGLDFSSLYPSIMMAYNLSPEKIIKTREELDNVLKTYNYTDIDFKHYKYEYDGRQFDAWVKKHNNIKDKYGIFPNILIRLFAMRKELKKALEKLKEEHEHLQLELTELKESGSNITIVSNNLSIIDSKIKQLDSKQKAVKVFMNTFYGESGNSVSPLFLLQFASGVTSLGQYNLKFVKNYVETNGYYIRYGDTDSVYLSCPNKIFYELDMDFLMGKLTQKNYWVAQIELSMKNLNQCKENVNAALKADNGSIHLTMAYEEILFPVVFAGKKKYYGLAHETVINLDHTRKIFIRGIDVIKNGISPLVKDIGMAIMHESMSYMPYSLYELCIKHMTEAFHAYQDYELFKLSMAWKPMKKNIAAITFYKRMKAIGEILPEPNERMYYVVIKPDIDMYYTLSGCKSTPSKGNVMEYFEKAKRLQLPIDKLYYFKNLIAICARISNHDDLFVTITDTSKMSEEDLTIKDQDEQKRAEKHITNIIESLFKPDMSKGQEYKKIFKEEYEKVNYSKYFKYDVFLEDDASIEKHFNEVKSKCKLTAKLIILVEMMTMYNDMREVSTCIHEQLKHNVMNARIGNSERLKYEYNIDVVTKFEQVYKRLLIE